MDTPQKYFIHALRHYLSSNVTSLMRIGCSVFGEVTLSEIVYVAASDVWVDSCGLCIWVVTAGDRPRPSAAEGLAVSGCGVGGGEEVAGEAQPHNSLPARQSDLRPCV